MRIYVAHRTDVDPPTKMASGSISTLRDRMRGPSKKPNIGADYTVVEHDIKPDLANLCQAIEDVTEIDAVSALYFHVNDKGHLREVK